jgi:hypothetical protein
MATESFQDRVDALTGFGSTDQDALVDWLTDGAREIINLMPPHLKQKCMTETTLNNSSQTMDLDGVGEIFHVTRLSADSGGYRYPCRQVPSRYGEFTGDSSDLMFYATATDPAYWISSSNDATILTVNPTPTANQTAIVYHVGYPVFDKAGSGTNIDIDDDNDNSIANFPDEVEHLVVLYAAIKAAESLLASEEDDDLYVPIINVLKADYIAGLQSMGAEVKGQQQKKGADSNRQMQALVNQMLEYQKQQ